MATGTGGGCPEELRGGEGRGAAEEGKGHPEGDFVKQFTKAA